METVSRARLLLLCAVFCPCNPAEVLCTPTNGWLQSLSCCWGEEPVKLHQIRRKLQFSTTLQLCQMAWSVIGVNDTCRDYQNPFNGGACYDTVNYSLLENVKICAMSQNKRLQPLIPNNQSCMYSEFCESSYCDISQVVDNPIWWLNHSTVRRAMLAFVFYGLACRKVATPPVTPLAVPTTQPSPVLNNGDYTGNKLKKKLFSVVQKGPSASSLKTTPTRWLPKM